MQFHLARRLRLPHRPAQPVLSSFAAQRRFYSEGLATQAQPHTEAHRPAPATELHDDFTAFVSQFRNTLPTTSQSNMTQYMVRDLKLIVRNLAFEASDAQQSRPYVAMMPLPEIPGIPNPPPYPAAWLYGSACNVLSSLYARLWRVHSNPMRKRPSYLYLGKHMFFTRTELAEEFQKRIENFMEKAKHHGHIDRKGNQLFYATNTHSAIPRDTKQTRENVKDISPGITTLDVRIAIRVEQLWDRWLKEGKAVLPPPGTIDTGIEVVSIVGFGLRSRRQDMDNAVPKSRRSSSDA